MAEKRVTPGLPDRERLSRIPAQLAGSTEGIVRREGLVYRHAGEEALLMDVYAPAGAGPGETRPGIIFVHGGPIPREMELAPREWGVFVGYGREAARRGLVGVTFNHRFHSAGLIGEAAADINALVTYVRGCGTELGIDPGRIALWVFSGGGLFLASFLRQSPPWLRALVAFYPLLDPRPLGAPGAAESGAATAEPFLALPALEGAVGAPPLFIGRAGLDNPLFNGAIDAFAAVALGKNLCLTLLNHPRGPHGFDAFSDDARGREIVTAAFDFLRGQL
jgi:acetyl esterase/lipase